MDYSKVGLKVGLEIHQRLKTHKLFCDCSSDMKGENRILVVKRKLRPVAGELGEVDRAAMFEYMKGRTFIYEVFQNESCLVELDEEPPHLVNQQALLTALEIALLLNCKVVDEIHVMRKTVIDGSNTSGFQRTMLIGLDGWINGPRGKVPIAQICLEEESAGIVDKRGKEVVYRLDRLGIPLVEITTGLLEGYTPEEIQQIAFKIGMVLRSTKKVMRGIGTIRQDINISIEGGARIEIKGLQEIGLLKDVIEKEVKRQLSLLEIKEELRRRNLSVEEISDEVLDVTDVFSETESKLIKRLVSQGNKVYCFKLPKFAGLLKKELCEGKTFGKELSDYAKAYGIGGIIHTDENLKKYHLEKEFQKLRELLNASSQDVVVTAVGKQEDVKKACDAVISRAKQALVGVPEETRVVNPDATTSFARPLPGGARMYPETDLPPIEISKKLLDELSSNLPESVDEKIERLKSMGIEETIATKLFLSEYDELFEEFVDKVHPPFLANLLVGITRSVKRETGKEVPADVVRRVIESYVNGLIVKEAVEEIMKELTLTPDENVEKVIKKLGLERISEEELVRIIKQKIVENKEVLERLGDKAEKALIGMVMREIRGRIEGEVVVKKVKELLGQR
ncbi:MAG: Glu-tRNA(Gln) amidotransferase subunit GatE [Candidatus Aenigmarchaeota archaeon]|nr:Glu-tRNA(Gln) amidotransferase subunit GatE [Candidatus Aenigmarchaeota archaeon]